MSVLKAVVVAAACALLSAGCMTTASPGPTDDGAEAPAAVAARSCSALLGTVLSRLRSDDTSGAINGELDRLGDACPDEYEIFKDYVSIEGFADMDMGGRCSEYRQFGVRQEAIALARQDGLCTGPRAPRRSGSGARWSCWYAPTMNRDWHDAALCSNGVTEQRPYLREWDDFVTQDELMESAREYERRLNGR